MRRMRTRTRRGDGNEEEEEEEEVFLSFIPEKKNTTSEKVMISAVPLFFLSKLNFDEAL